MSKFSVGDRVMVVGIEDEYGKRGEVTKVSAHPSWPIEVRFDGGSLLLGLHSEEELEFEHIYDALSSPGPNLVSSDDAVNHPSHYIRSGFEVIEIIEAFELNFRLANVTKYVLRCDHKHDDNGVQDLKKALWYLTREVEAREAKQ